MVMEPPHLCALRIEKTTLRLKLKDLLGKSPLLDEIDNLTGEGFSIKGLIKQAIGSNNIHPKAAAELAKKLAAVSPEAEKTFKELVEVCRKLVPLENPFIVY